jgi:hypothetical protein
MHGVNSVKLLRNKFVILYFLNFCFFNWYDCVLDLIKMFIFFICVCNMLRLHFKEYWPTIYPCGGRDSVVGIATRYVLDGSGFEPRPVQRDFLCSTFVQTGPRATLPPVRWVPGLFPGGKTVDVWRWPPTHIWRRVWKWVELYRYFPFVPPLTCYGVTFTFKYCTTRWVTVLRYCFSRILVSYWHSSAFVQK